MQYFKSKSIVNVLKIDLLAEHFIFDFEQRQPSARIKIYSGCVLQGSLSAPKTFKELYEENGNRDIELVSFKKLDEFIQKGKRLIFATYINILRDNSSQLIVESEITKRVIFCIV